MSEDKRKHKRFRGKEGAFAAFLKPNELINLGNIVDISMGGLCMRYLSTSPADSGWAGIKIFGSNGRFIHVEKVECRVIYDFEIPEGSWDQLSTRRCGVQFGDLSVRNKSMLEDFIAHFAYEENQLEGVK